MTEEIVFTDSEGTEGWAGRIFYAHGGWDGHGDAVRHCSMEDGFERWTRCETCTGWVVWCFCCGSVDREYTTCTCYHARTH